MASLMYDHNREEALSAIASGTLKVVAVTSDYSANASTHVSINDVTNILRYSRDLSGVTVTAGVLDADDLTLTAMTATASIHALIVYTVAGSSASSTLHVYLDTGTGIPVAPNGGDIIVSWAAASPNIYKL